MYVYVLEGHLITNRYIEVFRSSQSEVKPYKGGRPTPYSRPGGRGGGFSGYGTFEGGGAKYVSGYERNYRGGRGRGGGRGGGYGYGGDGGIYYMYVIVFVHVCDVYYI